MEEKKLEDFVRENDFGGSDAEPFPEGETELVVKDVSVQTTVISDSRSGEDKTRYILKFGDKSYWAGTQVLSGLKKAVESGIGRVKVIRQGQGMQTSYVVVEA